jgi:hypothetical protein
MPAQKYLMLLRRPAHQEPHVPPSPAQMQEMFARFNAWKEKFKGNLVDIGGKLNPGVKVLTMDGLMDGPFDGPFVESKEIIGGYMIVAADSLEEAVAVAKESPGMFPGSQIEIREIGRA